VKIQSLRSKLLEFIERDGEFRPSFGRGN
jgi:hypothetical protein